MCGIFGHYFYGTTEVVRQDVLDIVFGGLHRLEYRGYDSAGFLIEAEPRDLHGLELNGQSPAGKPPIVIKSRGNINALHTLSDEVIERDGIDRKMVFKHHVAIAHTRWATHGEPSPRNSHPISSGPQLQFVVVHNGIITNFGKLKQFLEEEGEAFETETDTEVIPKLCAYLHSNRERDMTFPELVMEVLRRLEGAYALLVYSALFPGELVACRRGSPLMFGLKNSKGGESKRRFRRITDSTGNCFSDHHLECFIASDDKAIIEHTREAIALEDGDVAHIKGDSWGIFNIDAADSESAVPRVIEKLQGKLESIGKGNYTHFMQKEIFDQPESLTGTMLGRVKQVKDCRDKYLHPRVTLGGMEQKMHIIRHSRRMIFVACGTSYHACLAMRPLIESSSQLPVSVELSSDFMDRRCPVFRDDTVICVSQSGETADTLAALRYAKSCGALCVGITNTVGSPLSRESECGVHLNAGYEMGVASTKTYSSTMVVLAMIALLMISDSISMRTLKDAIADELLKLPECVKRSLQLDSAIQELAQELRHEQSLLVFGRGHNYATALEAALKVKEVALVHSEGILAGELKHGPLALVDDKLPVFVIATKDDMYSKMVSVIQQLRARGSRLIVICNEGDEEVPMLVGTDSNNGQVLFVPRVHECLQPIVNIIPFQILSYHLTVLRGLNVDQPRNLAKSVTVHD